MKNGWMKQGRWTKALLYLLLVTLLVGCTGPRDGKIFRYDVSGQVSNLDPQYTTDPNAKIILHNLFEGLVHKKPDGSLTPAVAIRWEITPDQKTYTFYLREDMRWALPSGSKEKEGEPVTAYDFVFAFERIYEKSSVSPHQDTFSAIKNATATRTGQDILRNLGVKAKDTYQLEFTLERVDSLFLAKLSTHGAFPCNKEFFMASQGRYGLAPALILGNGPFRVHQWEEQEYITLRKNAQYLGEVSPQGINFFINRQNRETEFLEGAADILKINAGNQEKELLEKATSVIRSPEITWALTFNSKDEVWGMPLLRQALAYSANYQYLEAALSDKYDTTRTLLPAAVSLAGLPREQFVKESPLGFDEVKGRELYSMALAALDRERIPETTLLVPSTGNHEQYMKLLQQGWQEHLSIYIKVEAVPPEEMASRLQAGDYQMMLLPLTATDSSPETFLGAFQSNNPYGYSNPVFDEFLVSAKEAQTIEEKARFYQYAQGTLLDDGQVIPLYAELVEYVIANNSQNFEFHPFGEIVYFRDAQKS